MNSQGLKKMATALKNFLLEYEKNKEQIIIQKSVEIEPNDIQTTFRTR